MNYERKGLFEVFLFMASRCLYVDQVYDLTRQGIVVLSDRLMDSTTAYQGGGWAHGDSKMVGDINLLNRIAMNGIWPDLTLFLDIPIEEMYQRMAKVHHEKNSFFEKKYDRNFYDRVRQQYLKIAEQEPERFKIIDGTKPIKTVFAEAKEHIKKVLDAKKTISN